MRELGKGDIRLVVIESGGITRQAHSDALNEVENVGVPRVVDQWLVRNRIIGGSSHSWTGRCAPFDDIDYQRRDWVPHSGWPFGSCDMSPYLGRAAPHLGLAVGAGFSDSRFPQVKGRSNPDPGLDERRLRSFFWQYSRDAANPYDSMRFGPRLMRDAAVKGTLITNATAVHLNTNAAGSAIASVEVASTGDRRWTVAAPHIVLCAGGIENARLLLASNRSAPAGLGNARDLVGRFLMDHPRGRVARFEVKGSDRLQRQFGLYRLKTSAGSHLFRHGVRLSPHVQAQEGLLNCTAWLSEVVTPDDPWHALKRFLRRKANVRKDAAILLANAGILGKGLYQYFIARNGLPRKLEGLELDCTVEQQPDPNSRVTLSHRVDRYGVPLSRIDWRISDQEQRTIRRTATLVAEEFSRLGLTTPVLDNWVVNAGGLPDTFLDVAHPIGTTRMSASASAGVVDPDCQVHGINGLYVAGSSVFPTSGHVNPTHMIVALAVRLADTLRQRIEPLPRPLRASPSRLPARLPPRRTGIKADKTQPLWPIPRPR